MRAKLYPLLTVALVAGLLAPAFLSGCGPEPLGSKNNPVKMAFVPSQDTARVLTSGEKLGKMLEGKTGYTFQVSVPTSYAAVIEAMGAKKIDVAWLAPFSYVLAHKKIGAQVILTTTRFGSKSYRGQIIAHVDSGVNTLADLKGKKFAFVDPLSTSGYMYPKALLIQNGINPDKDLQAMMAGGHDKVVIAVYNKQADAGATYDGGPSEARLRVKKTIPDVMEKTKIIAKTEPIPNDTVSLRKDLPPDMVKKITDALLEIAKTDDGKKALKELYDIDGLVPGADPDYDPIRKAVQALGIDLEAEAAKPPK